MGIFKARLVPSHLPPVPTECGAGHVDLVMVIDGSKSVRPQNFELVKQFVNRIVDLLEVSPHGTRVGLVQYSSRVRTEFPLNKYHSADEIKKAVMEVEYMEKGTMTGLALKHMVEHSFSELEGARPLSHNVPRIGLVFTDGRSQDDISEWARRAKESGGRGGWGTPNCSALGIPGWFLGVVGSGGGCSTQHPALGCCIAWVRRGRCAPAVVAGCSEQHPSAASCTVLVLPRSSPSFPNSCHVFGKPGGNPRPSGLGAACWGVAGTVLRICLHTGIVMFAVGVGKAVEEELRAIASEPVEQHFSYSADFTTMTHLVENFKLNICPGGCSWPHRGGSAQSRGTPPLPAELVGWFVCLSPCVVYHLGWCEPRCPWISPACCGYRGGSQGGVWKRKSWSWGGMWVATPAPCHGQRLRLHPASRDAAPAPKMACLLVQTGASVAAGCRRTLRGYWEGLPALGQVGAPQCPWDPTQGCRRGVSVPPATLA